MSEKTPTSSPRKTALAPDLRTLDNRAARAWTERMAVRPLSGGRYAVDSQSGETYVVDLSGGDCTCPDHEIRDERCKHLRRVAIEVTARRVPAPGQRAVDCDACGTGTFVPETAEPPLLCGACGLDPGERVVDQETGDTLVVGRVTGRRADEVWIDAAGSTVADYPTNSAYPDDDIVVEAVYAGEVDKGDTASEAVERGDGDETADSDDRKRYAFPLSRLVGHPVRRQDRDAAGRTASIPPLSPE